MTAQLLAVTFDAPDPARLADFWAQLLGRDVVQTAEGPLLPGDDGQLGLRLAASSVERAGPNRAHLHVTSTSDADQRDTVAKALRLGAQHLDVGQRPEEGHVVLADPAGNEFCVIEPGNGFLAGCGLLGELSCEGTRDVGVFWARALGWPLVWDQDEETAVQSPHGGTKISWGGPPVAPHLTSTLQRLCLVADDDDGDVDVEEEVERLVVLGATRGERHGSTVVLADPDGNELHLHPRGD
jgi:catechol 2,3-dioxygenase-like lactoylglutathione lyase family enzyme